MNHKKHSAKKRQPIYFIVLGIISAVWLLLRVIPKPSRITYPCQRMAAANTVAFITWLIGTVSSVTLFRKARLKLKESKIPVAALLMVLAIVTGITTLMVTSYHDVKAAIFSNHVIFSPSDPLNTPMGVAQGIFPGRVVWAHDEDAITYDPSAANGFWWDDNNTNPDRVNEMFTHDLDGITGATRVDYAWDDLFGYTNLKQGKADFGYSPGEKIAIKVNLVMGLAGGKDNATSPGPSPQLLNALLKSLIEDVHIPGQLITVFDASARIPDYIMKPFKENADPEYQKVKFVGNPKYITDNRYLPATADTTDMKSKINWADPSVTDVYFVKQITEADYIIDFGNMKGHTMAGVTICAKNLYGSIFIPAAVATVSYGDGFGPKNMDDNGGLHKCATVHDFQDGNVGFFPAREMGTYNYLVDILGQPEIRDKTVLYIVDALYAGKQQNQFNKFGSFNNHYTASVFMSQDPVAIESVCLDFLRSEPICSVNVWGNVDNYLHEAALADAPPSGVVYNPGAEENHLESLGVHEHWNNAHDRKYSRNLGTGDGIELVSFKYPYTADNTSVASSINNIESLKNYPNPFSESTTLEFTVLESSSYEIDIFNNSGQLIEALANDNYMPGQYQLVWDARDKPAGIYHCRISSAGGGSISTIKLVKTH